MVDYKPQMFGRKVIYALSDYIDAHNVLAELSHAISIHGVNKAQIKYLWEYYKGRQPVLDRVKDVRPEICNTIVENTANEIVSFKVGYQFGEPVQYISRNGSEECAASIELLNEYMFAEDKASVDQELGEWQMVCGTAYRMILPDDGDVDEAPFEIYTLDPRQTFVVYSNDIGNKPLMAVTYSIFHVDGTPVKKYCVYTENEYFEIDGLTQITKHEGNPLGMIPIIEYPLTNSRLGCFEPALPLLDLQNDIVSNRMDSVEQTVQAFIKFVNCDIDLETFKALREEGAIKVKSVDGAPADVDMVTATLDQLQTQTLKDDVHAAIMTICGMPNKNASSSISDTGAAVMLRDGWSLAEARAKDAEHVFKKSEKRFLKLALLICNNLRREFALKLSDIDMKFTRRNYEAIQSKSQVLISMLQNNKIHPLLAFEHSGMFSDPEGAYLLSKEYYEEQINTWKPVFTSETEEDEDGTVETIDVEKSDGEVDDTEETENVSSD